MSGKFLSLQMLRYFTRIRELESLDSTDCVKDSTPVKNFQTRNGNITIKGLVYVKGYKNFEHLNHFIEVLLIKVTFPKVTRQNALLHLYASHLLSRLHLIESMTVNSF